MRNADTEIKAVFETNEMYVFEDKSTLRREEGLTPNGNEISFRWVYRDRNGVFIDVDKYRFDMAGRYNLNLDVAK
jgi:hypothetical protein